MAKGDPYCLKCGRDWKHCECDITEPDRPTLSAPTPSSSVDPVIPFGKYVGQRASEVTDISYLDWMVGVAHEPFKSLLESHLQNRQDWQALGEDE